MRRLAADDRAERDDAGVAARLRERHRGERSSNAPGTGTTVTASGRDPGLLERLDRPGEHPVRQAAVEAGDDDRDRAPVAGRRALEHGVAVRDVDLAADVLDALALVGHVLDHRAGLRLRPGGERIIRIGAVRSGLDRRLGFGRRRGQRANGRCRGAAGCSTAPASGAAGSTGAVTGGGDSTAEDWA